MSLKPYIISVSSNFIPVSYCICTPLLDNWGYKLDWLTPIQHRLVRTSGFRFARHWTDCLKEIYIKQKPHINNTFPFYHRKKLIKIIKIFYSSQHRINITIKSWLRHLPCHLLTIFQIYFFHSRYFFNNNRVHSC